MERQYRVIRSDRRTIAIQITPGAEVLVRCPRRMSNAAIHCFVESKQAWIEKHLADMPSVQQLTQSQIKDLVLQVKPVLAERTAYFAQSMGVRYGRITIRAQHTRWGSCSGRGNLNFNCLLALAPPHVQDYVVVHELCHLKQMNHSPAFWAEVEKILPDYCAARKWLKDNGRELLARLPK